MTHLERLAGELDAHARQYVRRYEGMVLNGNMRLAEYFEGRAAGLTQAVVLLRGEVERRAETDEEEAG